MTATRNHSDTHLAPSDGDDQYLRIVGGLQHWLDRLRLKVPRALCGVLLVGDPDKPEPGVNTPTCPKCTALDR